jgi:multiple sugar transport system substrate-binding protein
MKNASTRTLTRRELLKVMGVSAAAAGVAACAPPAPAPAPAAQETAAPAAQAPAPEAAPITLTHWQHHSTSRAQTVEQFKARYEDLHPNVTIDFQSIPWSDYWGKLAAGIAAGKGSAPDVFQIPMGLIEEYVAGDNLVSVDPTVVSSQTIEDNYLPWTVQRGKKGSDYYGLPLDVQTLLIYRNNQLCEEAGLDPKAKFAELSDFYQQAMKLTKKTGDQTDQIGCDTSYYSAWMTVLFQQFLQREQNGKPWIDPSTNKLVWPDYPEIYDAFTWFCKLSADTDDSAFMTGQDRFALGKAAMMLGHPVSRGTLKSTAPDLAYTITEFPLRKPGQQPYTAGSHWMWVVGKWAPDFKTAWDWVYFCTNKPAQLVWSDIGGDLPSFKDLVDDPRFRQDENANVVMDSLKYATPWEWVGWAEWVKETGDARDRVVVGNEDPQQSFNTMVENLNKVIETHTVKS